MSILVRNSEDRLCSGCGGEIPQGEMYLAKCKERSDRSAHCVYCLRDECLNTIQKYRSYGQKNRHTFLARNSKGDVVECDYEQPERDTVVHQND